MKKYYLFLSALTLVLSLLFSTVHAQITVTNSQTATALANKLVGAGVTMLNPTLTCKNTANGIFVGTSVLSFDSGIILSSGAALDARRQGSFFASTGNNTAGDAQLTTLCGSQTYDACVLQFDFRPAGDTVKFDYVFGSEEYTGFTCTSYNDVFAFFISGPGIAGVRNIALVPGTNIPVCINSVNCSNGGPCTQLVGPGSPYCSYYVNNSGGATVAYDGITRTLTAIAPVTPCDTYHLKIGIADANDDIYDSGVFLKAGSLTSTSFSTKSLGINPLDTGFGSQYCVRGCTPGMFVFHNNGSLNDSLIIHYIISGTGVNGVDYSTILDSAIIHAHDSTDTVFIYGLTTATGTKTVKLYILAPYTCNSSGPSIIDSVQLSIFDSIYVHINTNDTLICMGEHVLINTAGSPSFNYSWSPSGTLNNSTIQNPTAYPTGTTTYTVTASMAGSSCPAAHDVITISVSPPPGPPVITNPNPYCQGAAFQPFHITATGTVYWYPTATPSGGTTTAPVVNTSIPGTYKYYFNQVIGSCISNVDSITIVVIPAITADFTSVAHRGCNSDMVTFTSNTTNVNNFAWDFGDGSSQVITPNAVHTYTAQGLYTVMLTGTNVACNMAVTHQVDTRHTVKAAFLATPDTFCINPLQSTTVTNNSDATVNTTPGASVAGEIVYNMWTFGDGSMDMTQAPTHTYSDAGTYQIKLVVTDSIGCSDSATKIVVVLRVDITSWHDTTLCLRQPLPLNNLVQLYPPVSENFTYMWEQSSPNLSDPTVQIPLITGFGTFTDVLTATIQPWGCFSTDEMNIHSVLGQLLTNVTPTAVISLGSSIQLNSNNEIYYTWKPNDGSIDNPNINNPVATPTQTTVYTVFGMDQYGCVDSAFVTVVVDSNVTESIPSGFTPNGDGKNDVFRPVGIKYQNIVEFRVFNRWGQQVYYSHTSGEGWDGTWNGAPQDMGVYSYVIVVAHPGGPIDQAQNVIYKGNVTLIR